MNMLKRIIFSGFLTSVVAYSTNSFAASYLDEAKQYIEKGEDKAAIIQLKNHLKENPKDSSVRFLLGKSYLKTGSFIPAYKEISRAYKLNPASEDITLTYAQMLLLQKKYKKVNEILVKKQSDSEKEKQRLIYIAYAFMGQNKLADAKQKFSELEKQGENVQVYNGLAKIALFEKEYDVAENWLDKVLKIEPSNKDALQTKAGIEINNKKYDEALIIYNKLIQEHKDNLSLYLLRAAIKVQKNNFSGAETDIRKVLGKIENQPQANYILAQIKLQEKNFKEAEKAAQKVLNILPRHFNSMLILGIANFGLENYNQADKYLTQYLSAYPDNLTAQNILASIYLAQKKGEQALLILETIDEEKRNQHAQILTTLGIAYLLVGKHQEGIDVLNKAKALNPDSQQIQELLIRGQFKARDIDNAIIGLENLVDSEQVNPSINYLLIASYIQKKELQKAQTKLNEFIQKAPDNPALYNLMAVVEKLQGNDNKASEFYHQALKKNANYIPAYIGLAELANRKEDWPASKVLYEKIININKKYIKAYIALSVIAEKKGNLQEVEKQLKTGLQQAKGNIEQQISMANLLSNWYVKQKTPKKIIPIAKELNKSYPDEDVVQSFLVQVQIVNNRYVEAEQILRQLIQKNDTDFKHRLRLAAVLKKSNINDTEVLELLDTVIALLPDSPRAVLLKANYLLENKQYEQARKVGGYAERQFPELAMGSQIKGDAYRQEKQWNQALNYYQKAYQLLPSDQVLFIITDILDSQGKEKESLQWLQSALKGTDKDLPIYFKIANNYQKRGKNDKAIQYYLKILEISPDNLLVLNNLAWVYFLEKNPKALDLAQKAYEKEPKSVPIADTYAYIQLKQGKIKEGIKVLEELVKMEPEAYDIKFHLAEGYYLNGDELKSRELLKTLLSNDKQFSEKEKAKELFNKLNN